MKNKTGWYVLYVQYRHEKRVYRELREKDIEVFLPIVSSIRLWSDRKKKIETPLFPSYLFVNIKNAKEFHTAISINSSCSYVRFGKEYGLVTQKEIEQIKLLVEAKGISNVQLDRNLPKIGDKLKIEYGELSGLECEIFRIDSQNKIGVRLDSLLINISATIPLSYLSNHTVSSVIQ